MSDNELDEWISVAKQCKYLPEHQLKVSSTFVFMQSTECDLNIRCLGSNLTTSK